MKLFLSMLVIAGALALTQKTSASSNNITSNENFSGSAGLTSSYSTSKTAEQRYVVLECGKIVPADSHLGGAQKRKYAQGTSKSSEVIAR